MGGGGGGRVAKANILASERETGTETGTEIETATVSMAGRGDTRNPDRNSYT